MHVSLHVLELVKDIVVVNVLEVVVQDALAQAIDVKNYEDLFLYQRIFSNYSF